MKLYTFSVPIVGSVEVRIEAKDESTARAHITDHLFDEQYEVLGLDQNGEAKLTETEDSDEDEDT